jgi:hypothetical protein
VLSDAASVTRISNIVASHYVCGPYVHQLKLKHHINNTYLPTCHHLNYNATVNEYTFNMVFNEVEILINYIFED